MEENRKVYKHGCTKYKQESTKGLIIRPDSPPNPVFGLRGLKHGRIGTVGSNRGAGVIL